jgi:hypothetical protein
MLDKKRVKEGLEASVFKLLMLRHMPNGSINFFNYRIDYLKYDNCYHPQVSAKLRYYAMKKALN